MSKFCNNCGSQLEDQSTFCPNCGTACEASEAPAGGNVVDKVTGMGKDYVAKAKTNKMLIIIPIVAVVVILGIILAFALIPTYKTPIKNYFAMQAGKASEGKVKGMLPEEVWKYLDDQDISQKDVLKGYKKWAEDQKDELEDEYGKNFKISYKWTDKDEITGKELTKIKDAITGKYEKIKNKDIKKAYEVDLEVTIKGSEDDDEDESTMTVVQIGGKWYCYNILMNAESYAGMYANYEKE